MAGKSKRKRGKYVPVKKGKSRQRFTATTTQQPAAIPTPEAVSKPDVPAAPSTIKAPAPATQTATARHTYITTELRTIGILAGIMLTILVVLFVVLP